VQAYLKNVERKREKERAGVAFISDTPATPLTPLAPSTPAAPAAETSSAQTVDAQTPVQSIEQVPEQDIVNDAEFEAADVDTRTAAGQDAGAEVGDEAQPSQEVCSPTIVTKQD
jgi:hypothetical protein